MTLNADGNPVVVAPTAYNQYATVKTYDGSSWAEVDSAGLQTALGSASISVPEWRQYDIEVDSNGNIYIAFLAYAPTPADTAEDKSRVVVFQYSGSEASPTWNFLGQVPADDEVNNVYTASSGDKTYDLGLEYEGEVYVTYVLDDIKTVGIEKYNSAGLCRSRHHDG